MAYSALPAVNILVNPLRKSAARVKIVQYKNYQEVKFVAEH